MNLIKKFTAVFSVVVLSLGFALPATAVSVGVGGSSQTTVEIGGGTSGSAQTGVGATSSSAASVDAQVDSTTYVEIQPFTMTRADVGADTAVSASISPASVTSDSELKGYVAAQLKGDANISAVESSSDSVSVSYKQPAKFLGFIPVTLDATATVHADGTVDVSYPWYAFLAVTEKADLESKLEQNVAAQINGTTVEGSAKLSAATQAQVVAVVKEVMKTRLDASVKAEASGSVNAQ